MAAGEAQAAEADARELLDSDWRDASGRLPLPVDPVAIARSLDIRVLVAVMKPGASGALSVEPVEGTDEVETSIYVNSADSTVRQRFSCAHELGHFIHLLSAPGGLPRWQHVEWRNDRARLGSDPVERYANAFAAALLMPFEEVDRHRHRGVLWLALRFQVSLEAMSNRLKNLSRLAPA